MQVHESRNVAPEVMPHCLHTASTRNGRAQSHAYPCASKLSMHMAHAPGTMAGSFTTNYGSVNS